MAYKTGFLLECLVLSFGLRSASTLPVTVKHAIRVLPPVWVASLTKLMQGDRTLPSAATLSRARLYVDVGYMVYLQQVHAGMLDATEPPVLFGLVDSSPQGGRNWELFEMYGVLGSNLNRCAELAREMKGHIVHGADDCEEHERARAGVTEMIFHHVFPPTALGTRRTTLAMKLHAVAHALRLESTCWQKAEQLSEHVFPHKRHGDGDELEPLGGTARGKRLCLLVQTWSWR